MQARRSFADITLTALVVAHLIISFAHGRAHAGAAVPLGIAAMTFVLVVVVFGPVAGLAIGQFASARGGAWVVASTMTAALAFGVINHFLIDGPDHVTHIVRSWSTFFAGTAVLLAITEACGAGVGIWCAVRRRLA